MNPTQFIARVNNLEVAYRDFFTKSMELKRLIERAKYRTLKQRIDDGQPGVLTQSDVDQITAEFGPKFASLKAQIPTLWTVFAAI